MTEWTIVSVSGGDSVSMDVSPQPECHEIVVEGAVC